MQTVNVPPFILLLAETAGCVVSLAQLIHIVFKGPKIPLNGPLNDLCISQQVSLVSHL